MNRMQIIAESIDYLVARHQEQPRLEMLAKRAGYDTAHFQKLFKDHVGISPKRLVQYMNMRHARELLKGGFSTLDTALETGLSGTGRLHDLFVSCEGVTPGSVQGRGAGLAIVYGFSATPLGEIMVAKTDKGVCYLGFLMDAQREAPIKRMKDTWPKASFTHDDAAFAAEGEHIMRIWAPPLSPPLAGGKTPDLVRRQGGSSTKLKLDLYGTNFQIQVWQALLKIPIGETVTYQDIAQQLGRPKSSRAVGNAVGANPISVLIPCHRVIRGTGIIDNYGWGSPRKKLILAMEARV